MKYKIKQDLKLNKFRKIGEKAWKIAYLGFNPKCGPENLWKPQRLGRNPH
jgi:hypothetical protein